jgi:hypothetical protein
MSRVIIEGVLVNRGERRAKEEKKCQIITWYFWCWKSFVLNIVKYRVVEMDLGNKRFKIYYFNHTLYFAKSCYGRVNYESMKSNFFLKLHNAIFWSNPSKFKILHCHFPIHILVNISRGALYLHNIDLPL